MAWPILTTLSGVGRRAVLGNRRRQRPVAGSVYQSAAEPLATVLIVDASAANETAVSFQFSAAVAENTTVEDWTGLIVKDLNPSALVAGGQSGDDFVTLDYQVSTELEEWVLFTTLTNPAFAGGDHLAPGQSGTVNP